MHRKQFPVHLPDGASIRVDKFVSSLGLFTRSQIAHRMVCVTDAGGKELKMSHRLKPHDRVEVQWEEAPSSEILPEAAGLDILYEDDDCLVINKERGMVVHPAQGHHHGTLVQALLYRYADWEKNFGGEKLRPGIVHRLDKDTTGIIIAAKTVGAQEHLAAQFRNRTVEKTYLALCRGKPPSSSGLVNLPLGRDVHNRKKFAVNVRNARSAQTRYRLLSEADGCAFMRVDPLTGRTHQIRVHLQSIACPILGDPLYARKDAAFPEAPLMLHAWKLALQLPSGSRLRFTAPPPESFDDYLSRLGMTGVLEEVTAEDGERSAKSGFHRVSAKTVDGGP